MLSVLIGSDAKDDSIKELPHKDLCNQTIRRAMQTLGTEWGRNLIGQDIWVNALERRIKSTGASVILIPDVRFDSEAEMIFKNGGKFRQIKNFTLKLVNQNIFQSPVSQKRF